MDLEDIILSEVSQRKANTVRSHLKVDSKKKKKLKLSAIKHINNRGGNVQHSDSS